MGKPAAKKGDKVAGLDTHIVMVSTPAGPMPTPMPMPFNGTVSDGLSADVLIEKKPAATKGSTAENSPEHIPTGGQDGQIHVFEPDEPAPSIRIAAGSAPVSHLVWSPDGEAIGRRSLLGDGEYVIEGAEDSPFFHAWIFDRAHPFRLALFHGKALRYERELTAIVSGGRGLSDRELDYCKQKASNVEIAAHNLRREWDAAGLGPMSESDLGGYFDQSLAQLIENAFSAMQKLVAMAITPAAGPELTTPTPMPQAPASLEAHAHSYRLRKQP
jgi:hypothetical protein